MVGISTGAAILGASVIGGGAALLAGSQQASAADAAGRRISDAQYYATRESGRQFDLAREDLAPWRETGAAALGEYGRLYGVGREGLIDPSEMEEARGRFRETPGYQFRMDEGLKAVARGSAAGGRYHSGAGAKAMMRYGQGVASAEFGDYATRLAGLASGGQQATGTGVQAGQAHAANVGNIAMTGAANQGQALMAAAGARASGYVGAANVAMGGLRDYAYYNRSPPPPINPNNVNYLYP